MTAGNGEFLRRLEDSALLGESIAEHRNRILQSSSAEDAAAELVRRDLLTDFQANVLAKGDPIPLVIGDYVVTDSIGRGGMGYVLKAQHRRMKRQVAIKFLLTSLTESDELRRRFEREVEAAAQLNHQNIVTAYDAGVHEGSHYLVMQYVDGDDLSHLVKSNGPLGIAEAVDVIQQAALGLGYAHDRGIVHRDIKPGNLLLDREGVVRILDMGLARMTPSPGDALEGGAQADLTNTGSVMGTIDYMAPEQALDAKSVDHRADIYALGCTLYFLVTSNPPFRNDTVMRRLLAHREQPAPRITEYRPDAPGELDDIFATMMAKSPDDRFPSMKHLVVALDSLGLKDSEDEQMATLDMPDDGNGGFISLPDEDAPGNSDPSATIVASAESSGSPPSGSPLPLDTGTKNLNSDNRFSNRPATDNMPEFDATMVEAPTHASAMNALENAVATASDSASSDTDFTGVGETIIRDLPSVAGSAAARAAKSPPPWRLIVPAGLAIVALIAFLITRPDPATESREVTSPDSVAEVLRDDTSTDRAPILPVPSDEAPDRRAALAVLNLGGTVSVRAESGELRSISSSEELPVTPFVVKEINLASRSDVDDEVMSDLQGLSELEALYLQETSVSDRGLANLTDEGREPLPALKRIYLSDTDISEAGLQHLAGSGDLEGLLLHDTQVSRADVLTRFPNLNMLAIAHGPLEAGSMSVVKSLPNLGRLEIDGRQLSIDVAEDVARLKKLRQLVLSSVSADFDRRALAKLTELISLGFHSADPARFDDSFWGDIKSLSQLENLYFIQRMTDQALDRMQTMPQLSAFGVTSKEVSGSGLAKALAKMPNVTDLQIRFVEWDDEDIRHLHEFKSLRKIDLEGNYVTAEGVNLLRSNLPACRIVSDHGTFEPAALTLTADLRAARWILELGGSVVVKPVESEQTVSVSDAEMLPGQPFQLLEITLTGASIPRQDDAACANLQGLKHLTVASLDYVPVENAALKYLKDSAGLLKLHVAGTHITPDAIDDLKAFPRLMGLTMPVGMPVSALEQIAQLQDLVYLRIGFADVSREGFQPLRRLRKLKELTLSEVDLSKDPQVLTALQTQLARLPDLFRMGLNSCRLGENLPDELAQLEQIDDLYIVGSVIPDETLAAVSKIEQLKNLRIENMQLDDTDLSLFASSTNLEHLDVRENSFSREGIEKLRRSLPACRIVSDHGTFLPTVATMTPDRRAAEWVLSVGGRVSIDTADGTRVDVGDLSELPDSPFLVRTVNIQERSEVTDDGLINLRGCSQLGSLLAFDTAITDQGLANLTDEGRQPLEHLVSLFIARTRISDTGLQYLAGSKDLLYLDIQSIPVSDGSLLGNFRQLNTLDIVRSKISAEELSILRGLPLLRKLSVDGRQLEGVGSQHVSSLNKLSELIVRFPRSEFDGAVLSGLDELTKLELLELSEDQMNKALWSAVASVAKLESLNLDGDGVTDASIGQMPVLPELKVLTLKNGRKEVSGETIAAAVHRTPALQELVVSHNELNDGDARFLESLTQLTKLTLTDNDITAAAIESLHRKLPNCRIESDHGTFEPPDGMTPDRRAAEAALRHGGTVWVGSDFQQIVDPADLPTEEFVVTKIDLSGKKNIEDEFLTNFRGLVDLQILILSETSMTDRGLANLTDDGRQPLPALQRLYLKDTKITQQGLQFLSGSTDLFELLVDGTAISQTSVLSQFPDLSVIGVGETSLSSDELQIVAEFPRLDRLTMDGRHLTESMTGILADRPNLRALSLRDLPSDFESNFLVRLPLLTELYFSSADTEVYGDGFWEDVASLRNLQILMCTEGLTDQSLAIARPMPQVQMLTVMSKSVTGEGLVTAMVKFPNVGSLRVNFSDWTDNDVQQLHRLKSLGKIDLTKNSASAESIKALSAALPDCLILSDHGTFGPTADQ